ncbi:MAG: hypothetical protein J1E63_00380 [Muribaculaceae bacterium]|nr:hypothetical protein [Muribaculaceae bacterium]
MTSLIDTPSKVYYVSNGYLFDYDKTNDSSTSYTSSTVLSDNNVSYIRYNKQDGYLFIAYANGNIDLLFDNGKVVNIPDIVDAVMSVDKNVNSAYFENGKIYVATSFGVVIVDGKKFHVIDSGIYNKNVTAFFPLLNVLMIATGNEVYAIENGKSIRSFSDFKFVQGTPVTSFVKLSDNMMAYSSPWDGMVVRYDDPLNAQYGKNVNANLKNLTFIESEDGNYLNYNNTLYKVDAQTLNFTNVGSLPSVTSGSLVSFAKSPSNIWSANISGVANYTVDGTTATVVHDRMKPQGASSVGAPMYLTDNVAGDHIYVMNRGFGNRYPTDGWIDTRQYTDLIIDGQFFDVAGSTADKTYFSPWSRNHSDGKGGYYFVNSQGLVEDPDDSNTFYVVSGSEGIIKFTNGEYAGAYNNSNAPFTTPYGINTYSAAFDPEGNLWVGSFHDKSTTIENYSFLSVLPAAKRRENPNDVKKEDWKKYNTIDYYYKSHSSRILVHKESGKIFTFDGAWQAGLTVIDTKGTWLDTSDDEIFKISTFVDQDGKSSTPLYTLSIAEDKEGHVWIGTTMGVFEITNPKTFNPRTDAFNRIKVPRNDGTNYADYLLGSDYVYTISVDNSNRKWLGTAESGLFLVSPNGDRIIENFTVENSPLPTNEISAVLADKISNRVYVGTKLGLLCYNSNSSPVAEDFNNVYAYPNPVRPEYTGWITIAGLMENSLVKIADSQGNVVYETTAEGGMATWDGCTASGKRVKTGVYFVFASAGGGAQGGSSNGAVTKIMVVN